jgi:phage protein D
MESRKFNLQLKYDNRDISRDVSPFIESFKYVDRTKNDSMDDISVTFQDVPGLWRNGWWPQQGAKFEAKISVSDWFNQGDHFERDCGIFEIDDLKSSGPPSTFTVSAISVGIASSIRRQQNTRAWEKARISYIATVIAIDHDFELKWFSSYDPILERWEQKSQSDLAFLKSICEYAGLTLKITNKWIVIFSGEQFDAKKPEKKIRIAGDGLKNYDFNSSSSDVYSACEVKYYDPEKKELVEYLFNPEGISGVRSGGGKTSNAGSIKTVINQTTRMVEKVTIPVAQEPEPLEITEPEVGQILKINRRASDIGEAEAIAKAALRNKNMRQCSGNLAFMGRPDLYSGMNIEIEGFGRWDSVVWAIEEISHEYSKSGGYKTSLDIRGVLGY